MLYKADWSGGLAGWTGTEDWKAVGGMLANDGRHGQSLLLAPFRPNTPDYAVEAEIQDVVASGAVCNGAAGVFVRQEQSGLYLADFNENSCENKHTPATVTSPEFFHYGTNAILVQRDFNPGKSWHTYRVEAKSNGINVIVDGGIWFDLTDNQFLSSTMSGLVASSRQINVRSFKVIML